MFNEGLFLSGRMDWRTPHDLYRGLDRLFHFDFDPCPVNPHFNGLLMDWRQNNFVNPPYGREIGRWVKKGFEESQKGKTVVMLIPSRTDTKWWHDYVMRAKEIWFVKGRLKFDDKKGSAPFPSAIIVFKKNKGLRVLKSIDTIGGDL